MPRTGGGANVSYCGIGQIAAQVDITLNTDAIRALNAIYEVASPGVIVHEVSMAFGPTDVIAWIKTGLESDEKVEHPTMRLARWVNKVRNLPYVKGTVTTILVHDPNHEKRHARAMAREGKEGQKRARRK
jgi:hypothetical protein